MCDLFILFVFRFCILIINEWYFVDWFWWLSFIYYCGVTLLLLFFWCVLNECYVVRSDFCYWCFCRLLTIWTSRVCWIWHAKQWLTWSKGRHRRRFARRSTSRMISHLRKKRRFVGRTNGHSSDGWMGAVKYFVHISY